MVVFNAYFRSILKKKLCFFERKNFLLKFAKTHLKLLRLYNPNDIYNLEPRYIYDFTYENKSNLLHFNWGWDGSCDGWFAYGCFAPNDGQDYDDDSELNHSSYNFNQWINLVYNIQPNS